MTNRPTEEFEASISTTYGNYNYRRVGGVLSGPISGDKILGRISAVYDARDGTAKNVFLDQDVNTKGSVQARGKLLFAPSNDTELLLTMEYREVDRDQLNLEVLSINNSSLLAGFIPAGQRNEDPYDRKTYSDIEQEEKLNLWGMSADFRTKIGAFDVTNILSYREHDYFSRSDFDRSTVSWLCDGDPEDGYRLNEELRLNWSTGDFDWLTGIYYFQQDVNNESYLVVGDDLAPLLGASGGEKIGSVANMTTKSYAGFANGTWHMTDRLDMTLGGRYTYEEKEIKYSQKDPTGAILGNQTLSAEGDWAQFTPSVNVRYRIGPDMMTYATVSKGFKSGGFNDEIGSADGISFDPEELVNYELGLKTEWFNSRVRANIAGFYMDWTQIQIRADNPATPAVFDPIIRNAGNAHSMGVEVELLAQFTKELLMGINFSVMEAKYDDGKTEDGTIELDNIPFAPDFTANLYASYRDPISISGKKLLWSVGGEVLVRGETYLTDDNQEDGKVDPYALVNLRAGLESQNGRWEFGIWGRNITNEKEPQSLADAYDSALLGQKWIMLNDPVTVGADLRYNF